MMIKIKDRIASGLGSVLEWYDFALYGFFAPLLAAQFFPGSIPVVGILKSFGVFAIGFIARPLGALIFGYIGDKYGRAKCLKNTPILITIPTFLIAVLPTFNQIGLVAPALLILLRILQGLSIGGEFANNIVYLCESVPIKNRYFLGSIGSCTGSVGIFLASSTAAIFYFNFSENFLTHYGWRIAFGVSVVIGLVVYKIRKKLQETPSYQNLVSQNHTSKNSIAESWKNQKIDYLKAISLIYLSATAFYFVFMFLPHYINGLLGIHASKAFGDNAISLFARLFIIPILGIVADRIGGVFLTRISCWSFILLTIPLFYIFINYHHLIFYGFYFFAFLTALNAASLPGLLVDILKPDTRCTVLSFSFNFSFGVFGAIAPFIAFLLVEEFKNPLAPAYYLIFSSIITLLATCFINRGQRYAQ